MVHRMIERPERVHTIFGSGRVPVTSSFQHGAAADESRMKKRRVIHCSDDEDEDEKDLVDEIEEGLPELAKKKPKIWADCSPVCSDSEIEMFSPPKVRPTLKIPKKAKPATKTADGWIERLPEPPPKPPRRRLEVLDDESEIDSSCSSDSEIDDRKKRLNELAKAKKQNKNRSPPKKRRSPHFRAPPAKKTEVIEIDDTADSSSDGDDDDDDVKSTASEKRVVSKLCGRCSSLSRKIGTPPEVAGRDAASVMAPETRLQPHQIRGVDWLLHLEEVGASGILADVMGLGKTVQTIAYLALARRTKDDGGDVVLAPASTLRNWEREFSKFAPQIKVTVYGGSDRAKAQVDALKSDVVVTTYGWWERDTNVNDRKFFAEDLRIGRLILDEGHCLKNPSAGRSRRLRQLARGIGRSRVILSGTPIQNAPLDLVSLMAFLNPNLFDNIDIDDISRELSSKDDELVGTIKKAFAPFVLRRTKDDVEGTLPPKTTETIVLEFDAAQRGVYDTILRQYAQDKSTKSSNSASVFTDLRKAANHPLLLKRRYDAKATKKIGDVLARVGHFGASATRDMVQKEISSYSDLDLHELCVDYSGSHAALKRLRLPNDALFEASAKCQRLRTLLPELRQQGHKILLFSQWVRLLDLLGALCDEVDLTTCRLDGATNIADRQSIVDDFNSTDKYDVFLLSTRAGGLGINLTAATAVVLYVSSLLFLTSSAGTTLILIRKSIAKQKIGLTGWARRSRSLCIASS